jgi:iron complex outermembrane receptor protein
MSSSVRFLRIATSALVVLSLAAPVVCAADVGTISGTVTSAGTKNALQGATVSIPLLKRTELTDNTGLFIFQDVPAGPQEIVVNYSGFSESRERVVVSPGQIVRLDSPLKSSETISMAAFTVETQKEGQALSVTEQRNATNVKTVVALDEWGVLPTQNVGELFTRLPGISFTTDEDDLINNITVRGLVSANGQSLTRLNIDGMSSTGVGGNGRTATLHSFSASMYEQIEVIAGQTPDKRADGLGGQINLKTRSPLAMTERRRLNYSLSGRYNPSSAHRNQDVADHPLGYSTSLGYTEVFDVLGGSKNLGVVVNLSQQQVIGQFDWDLMQYPSVVDNSAAFFRDYDKRSGSNHRFITGLSLRADYRLAKHTTVSGRFLYNGGSEPFFHYSFINPFFSTNGTVYDPITNPAGGFIAGSNSTRAEIRPTGNSQMLITPRRWSFTSTNPTSTIVFEHDFGKLKIDHSYRMSRTHWDSNSGRQSEGGQLTLRTANPIGFILDNSNRDGRVFTQTAASAATDNVYNPASYTSFVVSPVNTTTVPVPQTSVRFDKRSTTTNTDEWGGSANAAYSFDTRFPIVVKAGADTVNRKINNYQVDPRRWYAVAGTFLNGYALMPLTTFEKNHGGQRLPVYDPVDVSKSLGDTSKWYEDVNFNAVQRFTSSRHMEDAVDAGYIQSQIKVGPLTLLAGVRYEKPKTYIWTYFRARSTAITAEPDPYKRSTLDFNRLNDRGNPPTRKFPSIHASYDITANLKARASWSTSYSRPDLLQLIPGVSVNDTLQTVTVGNPDLKPMLAKGVDLKLEYYTKNSGLFTATVYEKRVTDYLVSGISLASGGDIVPNTPDNGFDGLYGGYQIISPKNLGSVVLQGVELDFKQRLSFLPGVWKGLTVRGNYTFLRADAKFYFSGAQTAPSLLTARQIPGVIPRSGNLGLQYNYAKFGATFDVNYTGEYAPPSNSFGTVVNVTTVPLVQLIAYRKSLTRLNAGLTLRVRPDATLFFNASNLGETGPEVYLANQSRPRHQFNSLMSLSLGVTGQF